MESLATTAAATLGPLALYLYLNAKLHLHKDLRTLLRQYAIRRACARASAADRVSPYYLIEANGTQPQLASKQAIWARDGTDGHVSTYSFREVFEKANQYGHWFASQGVQRGDLVGLYMLNSPDFLFAWIGLWAVGAAPAMLNFHLRGDALVHCVKVSGARLVLADAGEDHGGDARRRVKEVQKQLGGEVRFVNRSDVKAEVDGMSTGRLPDGLRSGIRETDPMALFYTSGTTGLPKGCALPIIAAYSYASEKTTKAGIERFYVCMPFFHGTGGIKAIGELVIGNSVCIGPKFSASSFWRDVRDSRATCFVYVGETLRYLLAAPPSPLDRQHHVQSIFGNGLRPDVWQRFRDRFGITQVVEFFNSTEAMLALHNLSRNNFTAHAVGHHGFLQRWKYHNHYVPVAVDAESGDIERNPDTGFAYRMPYEIGGEILVRLPSGKGFRGYWRDPEATDNKIVHDVFRKGDCYYRTGDALRRDAEGRWYFLDRLGDTFRWKGENVSTAEVSEVLGKYPGVLEANVYGVQLPGHDGKAGAAAIHLDPAVRETFDHRGLLQHARAHLPRYAVPLFLRHVQAPFSTHNNKQNKMPLKREGVNPDRVPSSDSMLWIERNGRGATYVPFTRQDWDELHMGKAKL